MITNSSVSSIEALAENLANRGVALKAISETPLAVLVNQISSARVAEGDVYDITEISKARNVEGVVMHDITMDEVVGVVADSVAGNINVARNVVNPIIREVVDSVDTQLAAMTEDLSQPLEIVPNNFFEVWNNPILVSLIDRFKETPVSGWTSTFAMPELAIDELAKLTVSGSERLDEELRSVWKALPENTASSLYRAVFIERSEGVISSLLTIRDVKRAEVLMVHMMARQLLADVPDGVNASIDEFTQTMTALVSQTGRILNRILENREKAKSRGILIHSYPNMNEEMLQVNRGTIVVNGDVYSRWLDAGGEPEVLFGAFLDDRPVHEKLLLENKDRYLQRWKRYSRLTGTRVRLQRKNQIYVSLRRAVGAKINEMEENGSVISKAVMHATLDKVASYMEKSPVTNVSVLARKLVCKSMFGHTDALLILNTIDSVMEANEGIDPREAGLLATVEIVAEWAAEMIVAEGAGIQS